MARKSKDKNSTKPPKGRGDEISLDEVERITIESYF